jgi:hypothetical protein
MMPGLRVLQSGARDSRRHRCHAYVVSWCGGNHRDFAVGLSMCAGGIRARRVAPETCRVENARPAPLRAANSEAPVGSAAAIESPSAMEGAIAACPGRRRIMAAIGSPAQRTDPGSVIRASRDRTGKGLAPAVSERAPIVRPPVPPHSLVARNSSARLRSASVIFCAP